MEMQHIKNSSQHKEFQCPVCLKFFSRKFTLEMHFLIHQGVKPHACPFCGKCFRQKGTLMRHKALHSTTALFHCGLCNRSFRQKNVFLHHLKHRHKVSTENLDRRKWRTQVSDSESLMNTLPPFVSANTVAISTSDKNLENILFNTYSSPKLQIEGRNVSISPTSNVISGQEHHVNVRQRDAVSKASSDKSVTNAANFSECFNRNIPQNGSLWQCNVCSYEIPFDYLTCSAHVSIHEQKLKHKCCLCLKLFSTSNDYHQHMALYHDNSKLISEEAPSCSKVTVCQGTVASSNSQLISFPTCDSLKLYPNGNSISDVAVGSEETSVFLKNAELTIQPSSSDSYFTQDIANASSNKQDMTFTCIPCQMDFTVEEDFECHVKTHVQSILLSDSESLEIDDSNNLENIEDHPSMDKITSKSNKTAASVPLQGSDENGKNFAKYFSPSCDMFKSGKSSNGSASGTFHQSSIVRTKAIDKNQKTCLDKVSEHDDLSEERACFAQSKQDNIKEFHYDQTANEPFSSDTIEDSINTMFPSAQAHDFTKQKSSHMKENHQVSQLIYPNSHIASKNRKESICRKDNSLQKLDTARQPCHSTVVYLCAFCRKHLSSAKQLYRHVKLHVQSVGTKLTRKNFTNSNKINVCKAQICKANYQFKNKSLEKDSPSCTMPNSIKHFPSTSSSCSNKQAADVIQTNKNTKHSTHETLERYKQPIIDNSVIGMDTSTLQKFPTSQTYSSSSRTQSLYRCRKCRKTFSKKSIYHYHMQMHLSVCTFRCFTCYKRFLCKEQLLRHTRTNHLRSYQCKICSRVFQYNVVYRRHSKSCTKANSFKNIMSATGEISVPIISLQDTSKLKLESLVGIIPISTKALGTNIPERAMAAIPVISPTSLCQLDSLPLIGSLPLFG